jgi:hypothetical protein
VYWLHVRNADRDCAQCSYVVLDEADRMIDDGFEEAINKVLDAMPTAQWKSGVCYARVACACACVIARCAEDEAMAQEQERLVQADVLQAGTWRVCVIDARV